MRIAIVDLGTNTFNLFVAEIAADGSGKKLYKEKFPVKLGEGGITKGFITGAAFRRGLEAMKIHKYTIDKYRCSKVAAFGTSAIRSASNGKEFINAVHEATGISVQVIDGNREADLICFGVRSAVKMDERISLIVDIGGGSTEFIIANKDTVFWKKSFDLGAARLLEKFKPSDPITQDEISAVEKYLSSELEPLFEECEKYDVHELIGSSGSFDSLAEMAASRFHDISVLDNVTEYEFDLKESYEIYLDLLKSTREERLRMKGLVEMRVDMIVISSILIHLVVTTLDISRMRLSTYSLKEGVLWELMNAQPLA